MVSRYQTRLSGPLLDRIEIHITVPRVEHGRMTDDRLRAPVEVIHARVEKARRIQSHRFTDTKLCCTIANLGGPQIIESAHLAQAIQYGPQMQTHLRFAA
jgi:predicted ATPase with chaperone activity